ncbi:YdgH/BhsA/McbA-like domain containing protein, partial [Salmonella enterica]
NAVVHQVNADQAQNLHPMGTVSVSQIGSTPMHMRQKFVAKSQKAGANS